MEFIGVHYGVQVVRVNSLDQGSLTPSPWPTASLQCLLAQAMERLEVGDLQQSLQAGANWVCTARMQSCTSSDCSSLVLPGVIWGAAWAWGRACAVHSYWEWTAHTQPPCRSMEKNFKWNWSGVLQRLKTPGLDGFKGDCVNPGTINLLRNISNVSEKEPPCTEACISEY